MNQKDQKKKTAKHKDNEADARLEQESADIQAEDAQDNHSQPEVGEDPQALLYRIAELEQEKTELRDTFLRKQADMENFRKRMLREKEDAVRYANKDLLQDLIPVIDDFERALQSAEESKDFTSFYEGVKLIEKQFVGMLERKWGLKRMHSLHQEFDPQEHEALMMIESDEHDKQTVVEDFQKGYYYQDRVLRHAKVKVAVPAKQEQQQ